ncbi:MAG: hypothetical protein ABSG67_20135 [Thermoguttaceae bacterium]
MKIAIYRVMRETHFGNPGGNYLKDEGEQYVVEGAIGVVVGDKIRFSSDDIRNSRGYPEYSAKEFLSISDVAFEELAELEVD